MDTILTKSVSVLGAALLLGVNVISAAREESKAPDDARLTWRQSIDRQQDVFCISNVSNEPQSVSLDNVNLVSTAAWRDLISGDPIRKGQRELSLDPYQTVWLSNA